MDTIEQPIGQQTVQPEPTVEPNTAQTPEPTPNADVKPTDEGEPQTATKVHSTNWNNGRRRIEQRQSMKARIKELEDRLAQYEGKDDDYSRFQREQINDRIGDMRAMTADADATEFAARAEQWFGDETEQFMSDTYRYAQYVNTNEPDLLRYAQREYGPILLHEWYKRMDNPALRQQWLEMTAYEKGSVLSKLYTQIADIVKQSQNPPKAPQQQNIPVPNGGRQSPAPAPDGDFGAALGEALTRHSRR
jgi:hypothetical protein